MIPTRRLWAMILCGIPFGAIAFELGMPWALFAYNAALAAFATTTYFLAPDVKKLKISRIFDPVLSVRTPNRVRLVATNDGLIPIKGVLRDESPAGFTVERNEFPFEVGAQRETEFEYSVTPFERGGDYFRGTFVRILCPFGLVFRQTKLTTEQPVRVYPNVLALQEFDLLKQKGLLKSIGIRKSRIRGLGMEFESLRDYTIGDDYRKIDWKASARRGDLVVRNFEQERNQAVIIVIDVGRRMLSEVNGVTKLDHTLDACLMLAHAVANAGDLIGLMVYSDSVKRYIPPRKGRSQVGAIIEALHDLVADPVESDPVAAFSYLGSRWKRRSLIVSFTDLDTEFEAKRYMTAFGPLSRRHLSVLASVADPSVKAILSGSIVDREDLYNKAAALTLTDDRRVASAILTAQNVSHLDSEPQDLAAALVSFYFEVKERSLL